jgi:hypothetical protein
LIIVWEELKMRNISEIIILIILIILALCNLLFFIVSPYSGPIVGFIMAIAFAIHWWVKRNSTVIIAVAIIWFIVHIYELLTFGRTSFSVLIYLNLLLPIPLLYFSLKRYQLRKKGNKRSTF